MIVIDIMSVSILFYVCHVLITIADSSLCSFVAYYLFVKYPYSLTTFWARFTRGMGTDLTYPFGRVTVKKEYYALHPPEVRNHYMYMMYHDQELFNNQAIWQKKFKKEKTK